MTYGGHQWTGRGVRLADLPLEEFRNAHEDLDNSIYDSLGVEHAIASFTSYGSTAPAEVARQVHSWKEKIGSTRFRNKS